VDDFSRRFAGRLFSKVEVYSDFRDTERDRQADAPNLFTSLRIGCYLALMIPARGTKLKETMDRGCSEQQLDINGLGYIFACSYG